jgi:hypothetical protein
VLVIIFLVVAPLHWIYDQGKVASLVGEQGGVVEFYPTSQCPYYIIPTGSNSVYGDQLYVTLRTIAGDKGNSECDIVLGVCLRTVPRMEWEGGREREGGGKGWEGGWGGGSMGKREGGKEGGRVGRREGREGGKKGGGKEGEGRRGRRGARIIGVGTEYLGTKFQV